MSKPAGPPPLSSAEDIQNAARAFQRSAVILAGFELDLFTHLDDGPLTSSELAARGETDPRATDRLCNALTATGLLRKHGDQFSNTSLAAETLVAGQPGYLASLGHIAHMFRAWAGLSEAVRTGSAPDEAPWTDAGLENFIAAMHFRASREADTLIGLLDLDGVHHVLDVGGGSGVYSMAFCRAGKDLAATVMDLPRVVEITQRYVADAGFQDCIHTRPGDYLLDDFGSGYDLVFFSAIIHINSPEENQQLMAKAFHALNPGGRVVVQDFIMSEDRTKPAMGTFFALNMLVNTSQGDTYTESEVRTWQTAAGFGDIKRIDSGPNTAMIVGRKK